MVNPSAPILLAPAAGGNFNGVSVAARLGPDPVRIAPLPAPRLVWEGQIDPEPDARQYRVVETYVHDCGQCGNVHLAARQVVIEYSVGIDVFGRRQWFQVGWASEARRVLVRLLASLHQLGQVCLPLESVDHLVCPSCGLWLLYDGADDPHAAIQRFTCWGPLGAPHAATSWRVAHGARLPLTVLSGRRR